MGMLGWRRTTDVRAADGVGRLIGSRVARRMVALFALCALVPMTALGVVSYLQVSAALQQASRDRRHQAAKSVGMELITVLERLESELALIAPAMTISSDGGLDLPPTIAGRAQVRFRQVWLQREGDVIARLPGKGPREWLPTEAEIAHLAEGKTILHVSPDGALVLARRAASFDAFLVAEIDGDRLWGGNGLVPPSMGLFVATPEGRVLYPRDGSEDSAPPAVTPIAREGGIGELQWDTRDGGRLGTAWTVPLAFEFHFPHLTLLVTESEDAALAALASGRTPFLLVFALSMWVVLLLALVQVRKSLVPLDRLEEGAKRLSAGQFDHPVIVTSGDEFERLATTFNAMSGRLQQQFRAQSARAELDRAILSSLDVHTILLTALERLPDLVSCEGACIVTFGNKKGEPTQSCFWLRGEGRPRRAAPLHSSLEPWELEELSPGSPATAFDRRRQGAAFLEPLAAARWSAGVAFPIRVDGMLGGVLSVVTSAEDTIAGDDQMQLQRLTDQIAVALSNARLVDTLDRLNMGTLQALARTVDAKSPWTAGHSQRVGRVAVDIGRALGLNADVLDLIERGCLLHDIGKIAVPSAILNKPGRLTVEEYAVMKEHPVTGARILEPIQEYHRLLPIVLEHHEWFDGGGYPYGKSGNAIALEARVVAVADVFDAVRSARPYRAGMDLARSVEIIREGRGSQLIQKSLLLSNASWLYRETSTSTTQPEKSEGR